MIREFPLKGDAIVAVERVKVTQEFVSVSKAIARRYLSVLPGLVELTHDINRGLADAGPFLPIGYEFDLPIIDEKRRVKESTVIRLDR